MGLAEGIPIISKLLSMLETDGERNEIFKLIERRLSKTSDNSLFQIWLQRITLKRNAKIQYHAFLCNQLKKATNEIWFSDWLTPNLKLIIEKVSIIGHDFIATMNSEITQKEIDVFAFDKYEEKSPILRMCA